MVHPVLAVFNFLFLSSLQVGETNPNAPYALRRLVKRRTYYPDVAAAGRPTSLDPIETIYLLKSKHYCGQSQSVKEFQFFLSPMAPRQGRQMLAFYELYFSSCIGKEKMQEKQR